MKLPSALAMLLLLTACTDQAKARYGGDLTVASLPADICVVQGRPQVVSVSTEDQADIDLAYFDRQGNLKVQKYGTGVMGVTTRPTGTLTWPSSQSKLNCD